MGTQSPDLWLGFTHLESADEIKILQSGSPGDAPRCTRLFTDILAVEAGTLFYRLIMTHSKKHQDNLFRLALNYEMNGFLVSNH